MAAPLAVFGQHQISSSSSRALGGLGRVDKHTPPEEEEEEECGSLSLEDTLLKKVSSLPKERGWLSENIHQYEGFWYSTRSLKGLLLLKDHFQAEPTDILLASYPKSGTTWLKALLFCITNPAWLDHPENPLLSKNPHELVPFLEEYAALHPADPRPKSSSIMHTHIPYGSLPESIKASGCRIVYVFRDPKDVLVSCWHFVKKIKPEWVAGVSLEDAFQQFRRGASPYGPYWDHVLGYWKASVEFPERVLFLGYEDLKRDGCFHTKRLAEFLGHHPLSKVPEEEMSEEQVVMKVVDLCSFEKLSKLEVNESGRKSESGLGLAVIENKAFFRKGEIGDSKNHLSKEMMDELDAITRDKLKELADDQMTSVE